MHSGAKSSTAGFLPITRSLVAMALLSLAQTSTARAASAQGEQVWLGVSDIHLNIFDRSPRPNRNGTDTNIALFKSALIQMKRAVPNPAVVLIPGDFLVHHFAQRAAHYAGTPDEGGIETMRRIAAAFNRAFPSAQFAIALGNNDVPCGDYRSADGTPYLAAVTRIWAPLVNRGGAAPGFAASFRRGGQYTARLPVHGLRLVVLNTVPFSSLYRGDCGGDVQAASGQLAWLGATLRATPAATGNLVVMHIPPGFDALSTDFTRGLLAWPFLNGRYNAALASTLAAPGNRVAYAIASHTHHFDFRLAGNVPIVVLGSLSPIYRNNPTFYALRMGPDGSLRDIQFHSFDERTKAWVPVRSFDRIWSSNRIEASSLIRIHALLANVPDARALWDRQANGWPSAHLRIAGTWAGKRWRVSWCAQTDLGSSFRECAGVQRRVLTLGLVALALAGVIAALLLAFALRSRVNARR
ncbi:MAG: metallophosphoesterase [Candidatus Cybelea sp.]